jgi:uroporphyrinogen decarboxylase
MAAVATTAACSSRERVGKFFRREEADRVPIDYSSNPGIDARLKARLGLASDDHEGLLRSLGVDFRGVGVPYAGARLHAQRADVAVDAAWGWHQRRVEHASGAYWECCEFPLRNADLAAIERWPVPSPDDFAYDAVRTACERHDGLAIYVGGAGLGDVINSTGLLFGMEETLVRLLTDDAALLLYVDRRLDAELETVRRTIEAARGRVDFVWMGEDLGTQIGPMIGLDLYRRQLRPRHRRIVEMAKSFGLPVMVHTCGSSSWAYEDFVEMGVDAVDTLQPEAANMSPAYLMKTFGGRLSFHGCISTAGPVAYGTVAEVVAYCRRTLEIMMPGGGYAFSPTHQLQDNTPTENVVAMYETAREYGRYRH